MGKKRRYQMKPEFTLAAMVALGLFAYLIYTLIYPERF